MENNKTSFFKLHERGDCALDKKVGDVYTVEKRNERQERMTAMSVRRCEHGMWYYYYGQSGVTGI